MTEHLARRTGSALVWQGARMAGVKVIFLVRTLILARLLVPDDFGLLAIAVIAVDFLMSVTNFGMIPALVQRSDATGRNYDAAWTIGLLRATGVAAVVIAAAPLVAEVFAEPRAVPLIRVAALQPLIEAAASIKIAELMRELRFRALAWLQLTEALVSAVISIALASPLGVWALVLGMLAGKAVYALLSYVMAPYRPRLVADGEAAQPLIRFGRWILLIGVMSIVGRLVLQAVISRRLGTTELGLYFLAARLALIPSEVASEVVGKVTFPLYVRLREDAARAGRAFRSILAGIAAVLVPGCALLIALAPSLAADVLGERWVGTAPLIRVLALVNVVGLLGDVVVPIFDGQGRPSRNALIELVQSSLLIVGVYVLAGWLGVVGAALAWLPAVGAAQLVAAGLLRRTLQRPFAGLTALIAAIVLAALVGGGVAWGLDHIIGGVSGFVCAGLLGASAAAALLWELNRRLGLGLAEDLARAFPQVATLLRYSPAGARQA